VTPTVRIDVESTSGSYPVLVGEGVARVIPEIAAEHAPGGRIGLVSDSNVGPIHAERIAETCRKEGLDVILLTFPAGEASKTRDRWIRLTDELLAEGLGRDGCVVAVGGGVTTDLAGFVAATYLRGVPVVQAPTSYLAMIDASVGGKTGVDVEAGKNLVGAFHAPVAVVADTALLRTLPVRERREGLVEAVKHGAILDAGHLDALDAGLDGLLAAEPEAASEIVAESVRIKAAVVAEDEHEEGYRQILNFGHTVGHAVEAASGYRLGHGSAVAVGMLAEAEIGERMGVTDDGARRRLEDVLGRLLPSLDAGSRPDAAAVDRAIDFLGRDKKVRHGRPRYVLLQRVGRVTRGEGWTHEVPSDLAHAVLRGVMSGG
jgi:3-dehydroquinate synthase